MPNAHTSLPIVFMEKDTMKSNWIYILLLLLLFGACQHEPTLDTVRLIECAPMPQPVAATTVFVYDNEAYVLAGRDKTGAYSNAFWKYAPAQNQWISLPAPDMQARVSASACVVGDYVYIGLGYQGPLHQEKGYLRDFWRYSPLTQEWQRLADFPLHTTVKNCFFAEEEYIYALYGFYREFTQDVYRYDIARDEWTKLTTFTEADTDTELPRAMDIVGTSCQGRHFLGTGFNRKSLTFWAEWKPTEQEFVACQPILGAGRNAAACCATEEHIYLAGGRYYGDTLTTGFFHNTLQRYCPQQNQWEYIGSFPYEAENMVMVTLNEDVYIGMGETPNGILKENWYRIEK